MCSLCQWRYERCHDALVNHLTRRGQELLREVQQRKTSRRSERGQNAVHYDVGPKVGGAEYQGPSFAHKHLGFLPVRRREMAEWNEEEQAFQPESEVECPRCHCDTI